MNLSHKVNSNYNKNERISDYAIGLFPQIPTKNSVKKAIKKGLLLIDNQTCTTAVFVKANNIITFCKEEKKQNAKLFKLKLEIIYEDNFIAIINKPAGFSVNGNKFKTIENSLLYNLKLSEEIDALPHPLPVHRLDAQTSGLLIIAKTKQARIKLGEQFEQKKIHKKYHAVVIGKTQKKGIINFPIEKKSTFTEYELIKTEISLRNKHLSLIKLTPKTGRTHQLRIHCGKMGFPILGDKLHFGNFTPLKGKGLFLCATELTLNHPITNKELSFAIPYPKKFDTIIEREKQRAILFTL